MVIQTFLRRHRHPLDWLAHPREMIRQFPVSFFAITMGTGILAILCGQIQTTFPLAAEVGNFLRQMNVVIFFFCTAMLVARSVLYPGSILRLLQHPVQSMFLGMIPMGLATIVNGLVVYNHTVPMIAYQLWLIDVALSVFTGLLVPYFMATTHEHSLEKMSALWLLPIVPAEVAAASGGLLTPHLTANLAPIVLGTSYILWALSVPLALGILSILFIRMALHRLPPKEMAISNWLTLGPLGTGALGIITMSIATPKVFGATLIFANSAETVGVFIALILWGYGLWWAAIALFTTLYHARIEIPFNMGWWGLTFPIGVFTAATFAIGHAVSGVFFINFGNALTAILAVLYGVVLVPTIFGIWNGSLFNDPSSIVE